MARREVIDLEGFAHGNPIPVAVKIGNINVVRRGLPAAVECHLRNAVGPLLVVPDRHHKLKRIAPHSPLNDIHFERHRTLVHRLQRMLWRWRQREHRRCSNYQWHNVHGGTGDGS